MGDDLNLLDTFDALRDERDESLAAPAHVFVVVVRAVNGEIVRAGALAVDRKLAGGPDAGADAGAGHAPDLRRGRDPRGPQSPGIEAAGARPWQQPKHPPLGIGPPRGVNLIGQSAAVIRGRRCRRLRRRSWGRRRRRSSDSGRRRWRLRPKNYVRRSRDGLVEPDLHLIGGPHKIETLFCRLDLVQTEWQKVD